MTTIHYAYADPTCSRDRLVTDAEAEILNEDPGLVVTFVIDDDGVLTASDRPGRCTCEPGETCSTCHNLPLLVVEGLCR